MKVQLICKSEYNQLYLILKSKNQDYAYVYKKIAENPALYRLLDDLNDEYPVHLFYDYEFEPYISEERKLKLKKICSIKEIE